MVMLSAASALVAGSIAAEATMKTQSIKVRRPFWNGGKQHFAGAVIEVDERSAGELIAMGKAEKYDAPKQAPKPAPRVETPKDDTK